MARHTYKTALRAKGIKPLPKFDRLRSSHRADGDSHIIVSASEPEKKCA
jgi:hypothetical protein